MQHNNFPSQMQSGTKIIVRHRANGDTEYICRADDGFNPNFFGWFLTALVVALAWWFLVHQAEPPNERSNNAGVEKSEIVQGR